MGWDGDQVEYDQTLRLFYFIFFTGRCGLHFNFHLLFFFKKKIKDKTRRHFAVPTP